MITVDSNHIVVYRVYLEDNNCYDMGRDICNSLIFVKYDSILSIKVDFLIFINFTFISI